MKDFQAMKFYNKFHCLKILFTFLGMILFNTICLRDSMTGDISKEKGTGITKGVF